MFQCCDCETPSASADDSQSRSYVNLSSNLRSVIPIRCIGYNEVAKNLAIVDFLTGAKLEFIAGQHIGVHSHDLGKNFVPNDVKSGLFTIVSPPSLLPVVKVAVVSCKLEATIAHFLFFSVKINDILFIDKKAWGTVAVSPRMLITPSEGPQGLCLISGGYAVMSHLAIIEELLVNPDAQTLPKPTVIQSNRLPTEVPFYKQLSQLAESKKIDFTLKITGKIANNKFPKYSQLGRIDKDFMRSKIHCQRLFCVSGPEKMVESVVWILLDLGVSPGTIRTDYVIKPDPTKSATRDNLMSNIMSAIGGTETPERTNEITFKDENENYFNEHGLNDFFASVVKDLATEKPSKPFSFCMSKLRSYAALEYHNTKRSESSEQEITNFFDSTQNQNVEEPTSKWLKTFSKVIFGARKRTVFVIGIKHREDILWLLKQEHSVIIAKEVWKRQIAESSEIANLSGKSQLHSGSNERSSCSFESFHTSDLHSDLRFSKMSLQDLSPEIIGNHVDCVLDCNYFDSLTSNEEEQQFLNKVSLLLRRSGCLLSSCVTKTTKSEPKDTFGKDFDQKMRRYFKKFCLLTVSKSSDDTFLINESTYFLQGPKNLQPPLLCLL